MKGLTERAVVEEKGLKADGGSRPARIGGRGVTSAGSGSAACSPVPAQAL